MTKLSPSGKAAAQRQFKVYPSAYANAYASKVCAGKVKGPGGKKRKDFRGPKPSGGGGTASAARKIRSARNGLSVNLKGDLQYNKDPLKLLYSPSGKKLSGEIKTKVGKATLKIGASKKGKKTQGGFKLSVPLNSQGSFIQGEADGVDISNPSTQAYYKGLMD